MATSISSRMTISPFARRILCVVMSSFCGASGAFAQTTSGLAIFARLMEQGMAALAKEPAIAQRAPGTRGIALLQAAGDSAIYFVDDSALRDLGMLFAESAAKAPPERCARLYTNGADGFADVFGDLLVSADSALVDRWSDFMVRVARAGILRPPIGRIATSAEITNTILALMQKQPVADRERLRLGAAKTGAAADICFFTVTLYRQVSSLPASQGGPVVRALMRGVQPSIP